MAKSLVYRCEACGHMADESKFRDPKNKNWHLCPKPKCHSEDVFPVRKYRCKDCGKEGEQIFWFPELSADEDPLKRKVPSAPCEDCADKHEEEVWAKAEKRAEDDRWLTDEEELDVNYWHDERPANLEEIPVVPERA